MVLSCLERCPHFRGVLIAITKLNCESMGPYGVCKSGMYLGQKKVSCLERCPHFRGVLIAINVKVWDHIGRGVRDITSVYPFLLGSVSTCIVLCVSECTALYIHKSLFFC